MKIKSKEFNDLKAKWYKKLSDKGFNDIEHDEDNLKNLSTNRFMRGRVGNKNRDKMGGGDYVNHEVSYQAVETYYQLAGQFLHEHKFDTVRERKIWEMHANGEPATLIATKVRTGKFKANKDSVAKTIRTLADVMLKTVRGRLK